MCGVIFDYFYTIKQICACLTVKRTAGEKNLRLISDVDFSVST